MAKKINVRKLRERLGLTQAQLAEKLGVNQTTIHRWEMGTRQLRGPAIKLLAELVAQA